MIEVRGRVGLTGFPQKYILLYTRRKVGCLGANIVRKSPQPGMEGFGLLQTPLSQDVAPCLVGAGAL